MGEFTSAGTPTQAPTLENPRVECPDCRTSIAYGHIYCPLCYRVLLLPRETIEAARWIHKTLALARKSWSRAKCETRLKELRSLLLKGSIPVAGLDRPSPAILAATMQAALLLPEARVPEKADLKRVLSSDYPPASKLTEELSADLVRHLLRSDEAFCNVHSEMRHADAVTEIAFSGCTDPLSINEYSGIPDKCDDVRYPFLCDCSKEIPIKSYHSRRTLVCAGCGTQWIIAPTNWDPSVLPVLADMLRSLDVLYGLRDPSAKVEEVDAPGTRDMHVGFTLLGQMKFSLGTLHEFRQYWSEALDSYQELPYVAGKTVCAYVVKILVGGKEKFMVSHMLGDATPKQTLFPRLIVPVKQRLWFALAWKSTHEGWRLQDGQMLDPVHALPGSTESKRGERSN